MIVSAEARTLLFWFVIAGGLMAAILTRRAIGGAWRRYQKRRLWMARDQRVIRRQLILESAAFLVGILFICMIGLLETRPPGSPG